MGRINKDNLDEILDQLKDDNPDPSQGTRKQDPVNTTGPQKRTSEQTGWQHSQDDLCWNTTFALGQNHDFNPPTRKLDVSEEVAEAAKRGGVDADKITKEPFAYDLGKFAVALKYGVSRESCLHRIIKKYRPELESCFAPLASSGRPTAPLEIAAGILDTYKIPWRYIRLRSNGSRQEEHGLLELGFENKYTDDSPKNDFERSVRDCYNADLKERRCMLMHPTGEDGDLLFYPVKGEPIQQIGVLETCKLPGVNSDVAGWELEEVVGVQTYG